MNQENLTKVVVDYFKDSIVESRYLSDEVLIHVLVAEYESQGNFDRVIKILSGYGDSLHKEFKQQLKNKQ